MSISVHTRSVSMASSGANKFGYGLVKHVTRNEKNSKSVKEDTDSNIHTNLTKFNVQFTKNSDVNFDKAIALIKQRNMDREKLVKNYKKVAPKLKKLNKEKRQINKELQQLKKSKSSRKLIDQKQLELDQKLKEIEPLQIIKNENKRWSKSTAVGGISTFQLSNDTLSQMGWQFHDDGHAFRYDEQLNYQKNNPNLKKVDNGIFNVRLAYKALNSAINLHSERYGSVIASSLHFDESVPHLDVFTLNIGQDLDGNWVKKHIGDKDNGTGNEKLNIRQRTYTNGTNARGKNKQWKSKAQDNLDNDFIDGYKSLITGPLNANDVKMINKFGLHRGVKINDSAHKFKAELGESRHKASDADFMISQANQAKSKADLIVSQAHQHSFRIASKASDDASSTVNSANSVASNVISKANSTAVSLHVSYASSIASYEKSLKTSITRRNESLAEADFANEAISATGSMFADDLDSSSMSLKSKARSLELKEADVNSYSDSMISKADNYVSQRSDEAIKFKKIIVKVMAMGMEILGNVPHNKANKLANGELEFNAIDVPKNKSGLELGFYNFLHVWKNRAPDKEAEFSNKSANELNKFKSQFKNDNFDDLSK